MQLWLDDIRDPKDHGRPEAVWVKTAEEALVILREGNVTFISFDHDLGTELDGHDVATEIELLVYEGKISMPGWAVHSANPVGEAEITAAMKSAERFSTQRESIEAEATTENLQKARGESSQIHVGLEIGTTKICVCVSEGMSDGAFRILGVGEAPSLGVRKGEIVDPIAAAECIRMAIREAEASSGIEIKKVSVAVTGSHLRSFTSRASLILPKAPHQISLGDIVTVEQMASDALLPGDNILIQAIHGGSGSEFLNTNIDHHEHAVSGEVFGETCLKAEFHIIHGVWSRLQRTIDCLESLPVEVEKLIPSSLACAFAVLEQRVMSPGVLLIDLGGGTTDYSLTIDDTLQFSGVLAVGGDHITNDLSIGLRLPIAKAETLKLLQGSAGLLPMLSESIAILEKGQGVADYEIDRKSLNTMIHLRVREIFQQIHDHISSHEENGQNQRLVEQLDEIILTGGGSKLQGITEVAEQVFKLPVKLGHAGNVSGKNMFFEDPAFTTAIGITKYAMEATPNSSAPCEVTKRPFEKAEYVNEFQTNEEYHSALRRERDPGKNLSHGGDEDLDVPTFLRKGADGVEIKPAK